MLGLLVTFAILAGASEAAHCAAAARDIARGEHLTAAMLEAVPCRADAQSEVRLAFDSQTRTAVTTQAVPRGTYLGRLQTRSAAILPKGSRVTLRARSGPAIIEREVTTLQPAQSGQRVFVRDSSGQVFAVPLIVSEGAQ